MYKRRRGWWEEYGIYIQKSPTRDVWIVGFGGMGKREGGPTWEFDSYEGAERAVSDLVSNFWDYNDNMGSFLSGALEGGLSYEHRSSDDKLRELKNRLSGD